MRIINRIIHTFLTNTKRTSNGKRFRMSVAAVVVFVITYSLILPAIAIEKQSAESMPGLELNAAAHKELNCAFSAHTHTDKCYKDVPVLDGNGNDTGQTEKVLVCGKADWVVHMHDENCYQDGVLVCGLPEIPEHLHTEACYQTELVLRCGNEEHTHTDNCYEQIVVGSERELICGHEEGEVISPAVWSDPVYSDPVLDEETGEVLEDAKIIRDAELIQEEVIHHHDSSCYKTVENTELQLDCEKKEHEHSSACFREEKTLVCGAYELHTHTPECYEKGPKGESPEEMGWVIYETDENGNTVLAGDPQHLICGQVELLAHQHTDACFTLIEEVSDNDAAGEDSFVENVYELNESGDADENALPEENETGEDITEGTDQPENGAAAEWITTKDDENSIVEAVITDEDEDEAEKTEKANADKNDVKGEAFEREIKVDGASYTIHVSGGAECGIPADAVFKAKAVTDKELNYNVYRDRAFEAVEEEINEDETGRSHAEKMLGLFDLTIFSKDGEVIKAMAPISVTIHFGTEVKENDEDGIYAVHFPGTGIQPVLPRSDNSESDTDESEAVSEQDGQKPDRTVTDQQQTVAGRIVEKMLSGTVLGDAVNIRQADVEVIETTGRGAETVTFDAADFSVYAIVYTVDFHWEVDGKTYEFSLPGGGFVSLSKLIEVLGAAENDMQNGTERDDQNDLEADLEAVRVQADETTIMLENVQVSEETRKFVADVKSVEFSTPELLSVSKVEEDTTAGAIKDVLGLECEYSAELTEEQIAEINAQVVEAGDWAMISLKPFESEEMLTVTMTDGEVFTIRVTDAQINDRNYIESGSTYYMYTVSDGNNYAVSYDGSGALVNSNSPSLPNDYIWRFTYDGSYWTIQNIGHPEYYIDLKNGSVTSKSASGISITNRTDGKGGFDVLNWENNNWVNLIFNKTTDPYSFTTSPGSSGSRMRLLDVVPSETQSKIVTLHFVDEEGHPLEGFTFNGNAISGSTFDVTADWAALLGEIDLEKFVKNGYTLSNTHKSTWQDINDNQNDTYTHSIIGNKLRWSNGTVQYRLFYTNHDKAGSHWFDAGKEPVRDSNHWQYNNGDPTDYSVVDDNDANPYDYYLVYSPTPGSGGSSEQPSSGDSIDDIGKSKTLTPNGDGTYTMDLSVTTHAKGHEESNGINLIIVFDTSSSMRRSVNDANTQYGANDFKNHTDSRFIKARDALKQFLLGENSTTDETSTGLCPSDNATSNLVELALIDFNYSASTHKFGQSYWTNSANTFINTLNSLSCPSGTNWAQALDTVDTVAKTADEDPTYVLLMTDGAPSQYWDPSEKSNYYVSGEGCYLGARDEARDVVNDGYELYGVFSFGDATDENNAYLSELVDYAYNANVRADHSYYASDPQKLTEALNSIFGKLYEKIAHADVNYHDGIALDTTSTALSANVNGTLGSVTYSKTGGTTEAYTVKTTPDGTATFRINGTPYNGDKVNLIYTKVSGSTSEEGGSGIVTEEKTATVYSCTIGDKTYQMPIATLETDAATRVADLNWDLSPLGLLEEGATYTISFVVWPNQEAYDYVADLNNGIKTWNIATQTPVYDEDETLIYYKNGAAGFPNIVFYPSTEKYAVLTNTVQEVSYYIATEDKQNDITEIKYDGQYKTYPVTPDPMPLTATDSEIEKVWNVERDPGILAQLLYNLDGSSKKYSIPFEIIQGSSSTPYMIVNLGWDETEGKYIWEQDSVQTVSYNNYSCEVGTRWASDFSIATGLMLSEGRMDELGLDKSAYASGDYNGSAYYLLEDGHDYTIKEPGLTYEFDFSAPTYHPMLVDGVLQSVNYTRTEGGITITKMTSEDEGLSSLKIENTLRGYINLNKVVLDSNGETVIPDDDTKFTYTVVLENTTDPGPFIEDGSHIPWYGISGLYYHTKEEGVYHYYQAKATTTGHLSLQDENGIIFDATCDGDFNEDIVGPTTVRYKENGIDKSIQLYGNQMNCDSQNKVTTEIQITRAQTLNIANVPVGSTYSITESDQIGYQIVKIEREIKINEEAQVAESSDIVTGSSVITGTIVANRDNHITFYNKMLRADISIQKLDENGRGLAGAVFELKKVKEDGHTEIPAADIASISGIGTVTKEVEGEVKRFESAFETTGAIQTIQGLPSGTYRLREIYVPAGYISTYQYIQFEVKNESIQNVTTDTGDTSKLDFSAASGDGAATTIALLKIANEPGSPLPHTGGPGTRIFKILGMLLIAGAALLLWKRRRAI